MILRVINPVVAYLMQINIVKLYGEEIVTAVCFIVEFITRLTFSVYIGKSLTVL